MAGIGILHRQDEHLLRERDARRQRSSSFFVGWLAGATALTALVVVGLIGTILVRGLPAIDWTFLSAPPVEGMKAGGIWPMIRGTLLLMAGTFVIVIPLGVLGGICLAEYAGQGKAVQLLRACVTSLAGTPSIIFGLFGLAIFVLMFKLGVSLLSGWLTLGLFAVPVIILATDNAIRQVPESYREGANALGLLKWQATWRVILPNAFPGIVTGIVLSTGRAAGEAPPILLTAGIYYSTAHLGLNAETLEQPVANLAYHLAEGYRQGGVIPEKIIWGTCLVLKSLVLLINLAAILVRSRVRKRASTS